MVLTLLPSISSQAPSSHPEPTSTTLEGGGGGLHRQSKVLPPLAAAEAKVFPAWAGWGLVGPCSGWGGTWGQVSSLAPNHEAQDRQSDEAGSGVTCP